MGRQNIRHTSGWLFIAALAGLCAILAAVQHRWTGELARAEVNRLVDGFKQQAQQLCDDFDQVLEQATTALEPSEREFAELGLEEAHLQAWQRWQATKPRPIFSRIAVAENKERSLVYHELDLRSGALRPGEWPTDWQPLRRTLEAMVQSGGPPFNDPWGLVFELPVFRRQGEIEWLIFELDENYLATQWMPALIQKRLTIENRPLGHIRIKAQREPAKILFTSGGAWEKDEKPVHIGFNSLGRPGKHAIPVPLEPAWTLEALRTPESIEQLVSTARWRNLCVAGALNMLILVVGILLVRHTRRSRELASRQMQFVATVSHELRTPLAVIKGAAHNLRQGIVQDPDRVNRYLDVISDNTTQLTSMVEQVLAQAGVQRADLTHLVELPRVLHAAVETCKLEIESAGCCLETSIPDSLPTVKGDPAALQQVVQNILQNAAKHAAQGRWISLSACAKNDATPPRVEITVTDRGPGIPKAEQAAIFEPFVRGSAAITAQTRGSGLGLSLVKEIITAHHGHIQLQSDPEGSSFTFSLPQTAPA